MITFKLFLEEENKIIHAEELMDAVMSIKKDCQPFLKESNYEKLYRGIIRKSGDKNIQLRTVRTDRKPRNSPRIDSEELDNWFFKNYGDRIRSAGLFCSGDKSDVIFYSSDTSGTSLIFPKGEFKFYAFKNIRLNGDWVSDSLTILTHMVRDADSDAQQKNLDSLFKDKFTVVTDDLEGAIYNKAEIIIMCKDYYAISIDFLKENDLTDNKFIKLLKE